MYQKILIYILSFVAVIYVSVNIYFTQHLPAYFFDLVYKKSSGAAVVFIKKISKQSYFADQFDYFKTIYGGLITQAVLADATGREGEIKHYKTLLDKNNHARDILIRLAIIYFESDNPQKAQIYYQQAKKIDPTIYIDSLEIEPQ